MSGAGGYVAMLRRSSGVALVVHAARVVAAIVMTWPLTSELQSALIRHTYRAQLGPDAAALALEIGARQGWPSLPWAAGAVLAYALLAPLLSMTWLHSMLGNAELGSPLRRGLRAYPASLGLAVCVLLLSIPGIATPALLLRFGPGLLPDSVAAERIWLAACAALGLLAALLLLTVHDLARAALATDQPKPLRALRAGMHRLSWRALCYRALLVAAAAALIASNEALSRVASGSVGPTGLLALQQTSLLLATLLRALWLAWTLSTQPRSGSPATRAV